MKKYLIAGALSLIVGLIVYSIIISNLYNKEKAERQIFESNQTALLSQAKEFKVRDSLNAVTVQRLQLEISDVKAFFPEVISLAKDAKINPNRITAITETIKETSSSIVTEVKDSIRTIIRDNKVVDKDTIRCFDYKDKFLSFDGCREGNNLYANYSIIDSTIQYLVRVPKKFLFFKYGTKGFEQTIIPKNPNCTIVYNKYIEIRE